MNANLLIFYNFFMIGKTFMKPYIKRVTNPLDFDGLYKGDF